MRVSLFIRLATPLILLAGFTLPATAEQSPGKPPVGNCLVHADDVRAVLGMVARSEAPALTASVAGAS